MRCKKILILIILLLAMPSANAADVVTKYNEDVPIVLQDLYWACADAGSVGWGIATEDIPRVVARLWWYTKLHPQATFLVTALLTGYLYMRSQRKNPNVSVTTNVMVTGS